MSLSDNLKFDPKFTHDAYDRYKQNFAYLGDNASLLNNANVVVSRINNVIGDSNINVQLYDKYLTANVHDNVMGIINDPAADARLSSRIVKDIHEYKLGNNDKDIDNLYRQHSIPSTTKPVGQPKAFKNHETSNIINVDYIKPVSSSSTVKKPFIIYANDGCLQYNVDANTQKTNLNIAPCRATNTNQQFYGDKIDSKDKYNNYFNNQPLYQITNDSILNLGFYTVRPNNSSSDCIVFGESGLSVQPCDMSISQKFSALNNQVYM
jgi:hypothetical protein